jgi:hypothetical protein
MSASEGNPLIITVCRKLRRNSAVTASFLNTPIINDSLCLNISLTNSAIWSLSCTRSKLSIHITTSNFKAIVLIILLSNWRSNLDSTSISIPLSFSSVSASLPPTPRIILQKLKNQPLILFLLLFLLLYFLPILW